MELWRTPLVFVLLTIWALQSSPTYGVESEKPRSASISKLRISKNSHYIVREDGAPFVWIGDTVWDIENIPPSKWDQIFENRKRSGFTLIQIKLSGQKSVQGFEGGDILKPKEEFWKTFPDSFIRKAADYGLYIGVAPFWSGAVKQESPERLRKFGKWLGARYADDDNIVWLTVGEASLAGLKESQVEALVKGIKEGDTGKKLVTVHMGVPVPGTSVAGYDFVDFHSWQTGQSERSKLKKGQTVWSVMEDDWRRSPPKPTIVIEANYEGKGPYTSSWVVRRTAYFTVFGGAFGHTYGAAPLHDGKGVEKCLRYEGGAQMGILGRLLLKFPATSRIPAQEMITDGQSDSYDSHVQASRDAVGRYALVYVADGHPFALDLSTMSESSMQTYWVDPRNGSVRKGGVATRGKKVQFDPPGETAEGNDWVLMLLSRSGA